VWWGGSPSLILARHSTIAGSTAALLALLSLSLARIPRPLAIRRDSGSASSSLLAAAALDSFGWSVTATTNQEEQFFFYLLRGTAEIS
jgi:hypothetical protein